MNNQASIRERHHPLNDGFHVSGDWRHPTLLDTAFDEQHQHCHVGAGNTSLNVLQNHKQMKDHGLHAEVDIFGNPLGQGQRSYNAHNRSCNPGYNTRNRLSNHNNYSNIPHQQQYTNSNINTALPYTNTHNNFTSQQPYHHHEARDVDHHHFIHLVTPSDQQSSGHHTFHVDMGNQNNAHMSNTSSSSMMNNTLFHHNNNQSSSGLSSHPSHNHSDQHWIHNNIDQYCNPKINHSSLPDYPLHKHGADDHSRDYHLSRQTTAPSASSNTQTKKSGYLDSMFLYPFLHVPPPPHFPPLRNLSESPPPPPLQHVSPSHPRSDIPMSSSSPSLSSRISPSSIYTLLVRLSSILYPTSGYYRIDPRDGQLHYRRNVGPVKDFFSNVALGRKVASQRKAHRGSDGCYYCDSDM